MQTVDQIIHAKWILTCTDDDKAFEDHALVIHQGKIIDIIPNKNSQAKYSAKERTDCTSHIVMPGFVNAHTHIAMNLFKGLADDLPLMDWLNHFIWPAEKKWVDAEFVKDASLLAMAEMIRSGTTCFNDMYFFLDATADAAKIAGIRANIGITIINVPTAWAKNTEEYFTKGLAFLDKYKNQERLNITLAPHAPYTVADNDLVRVKQIADDNHLKINMHVHETSAEVEQSLKEKKMRPLKRLSQLGLVSPQLIAIHMTQVNPDDLKILLDNKPNIVHCPESNMKLASGVCPISALQPALNVALGTDGAASNNDLDMIGEMRTASYLSKLTTQDSTALPSKNVLKMATHNGAKALGLDKTIGTLEIGKSADVIAINLETIETQPAYHPASQIVYATSRNQVTDVWVAGKQLLKNRKLLTLDEKELLTKTRLWQNKIKTP